MKTKYTNKSIQNINKCYNSISVKLKNCISVFNPVFLRCKFITFLLLLLLTWQYIHYGNLPWFYYKKMLL